MASSQSNVKEQISQGDTLADLEANFRDACELVLEDEAAPRRANAKLKEIEVEV